MRLALFGATGRTGTLLVRRALARGDEVTAIVRDPRRLDTAHPLLTVLASADLSDTARIADGLAGADAVLSAIGPRGRKDAPVASPATRAIITAMFEAAVTRIVVVSAAPVGLSPNGDSVLNRRVLLPAVGAILKPVYDDLRAMEAELAASAAVWTAFRPPKLTNGVLRGTYRTALGASVPRGYSLSRADLAHAMLAALDQHDTERKPVGIAY
jgi:putative NADH-flavin reductase